MNLLYLVRHGENRANLTREFSYRKIDYPLTEKGTMQARQTAEFFRDKGIDAIFSSPLRRATQTAQIIAGALGLNVVVVEQFRELNVGVLEDSPPSEETWALHDQICALWRAGHQEARFPGGEDYVTMLARMRDGLCQVLQGRDRQRLIIVGHGGIFRMPMADLCLNARGNQAIDQPIPNCAISGVRMSCRNGTLDGHLVWWADVSHLAGAADT